MANLQRLLLIASGLALGQASTSHCAVVEEKTCYPSKQAGNDIASFTDVADAAECCARCTDNKACAAFTYNYDGAPHAGRDRPPVVAGPRCILKAAVLHKTSGNCTSGSVAAPAPPPPAPPHADYCRSHTCRNVLYLLADDMRAAWGSYGIKGPITPNLDKLASESLLFTRAYCQISVCAPSRMSFMTSRRPDTYGVWNFIDTVPTETQATPGHFKDHGYITLGLGKGFHQNNGAWNAEKYWDVDSFAYYNYGVGKCPHGGQGGGHCVQKDEEIYDWQLKEQTLTELTYAIEKGRNESRPFFVMAGFRKPHAPWQAPQRMYDLYNESSLEIPEDKLFPRSSPLIAWSQQLGVQLENGTSFHYSPTQAVPDRVIRDQRHAYYASISYVDEHVGALLALLDEQQVSNNTLVVFHADHGYNLGEQGEWEKKSNFDNVVRVPMAIRAPWKGEAARGVKTSSLTELVDVMPTMAALAGLPLPEGVDGEDLSELLDRPAKPVKGAAYHQYPACGCNAADASCFNQTRAACNNAKKETFNHMGYTVRVDNWRYTVWLKWLAASGVYAADWDGDLAEELYDHEGDDSTDFHRFEHENVAAKNPEVAAQLRAQLRTFFDKDPKLVRPTASHQVVDESDPFDLDFI